MYVVPRRLEKKIQVVSSSWTSCIMSLVRFVSDHWRTRMDKEQIINSTLGTDAASLRFTRGFSLLFADDWHLFGILASCMHELIFSPAKMPGIWPGYTSPLWCVFRDQLIGGFPWRKERAPNYVPAGFGVVAFIYAPRPWGLFWYQGDQRCSNLNNMLVKL